MGARVRKDHALVYSERRRARGREDHLDVDPEGATIRFGHEGPDVITEFADVDNLERLAVLATDGVRQHRAQPADHRAATAVVEQV